MKEKIKNLVAVASWEDRFVLGIERALSQYDIENIKVIYSSKYAEETENNRKKVEELCKKRGVQLTTQLINISKTLDCWNSLEKFAEGIEDGCKVIFDITTAPRVILWGIEHFLESKECSVIHIYNKVANYSGDWQSKDPGEPEFIYKHSGQVDLGMPLLLLVLPGFDIERTQQLINRFEPKKVLLGLQDGSQFDNKKRNVEMHKKLSVSDIEFFEVDFFQSDHGLNAIRKQLGKYIDSYNVIASSLGPKPSAITLYKIHKERPKIALCYIPSYNYNTKYSDGVGKSLVLCY